MTAVPVYERQEGGRACGPACLRMLYALCGIDAGSQDEIWRRVRTEELCRPAGSRPHRLAADARWAGLDGVALAARDPDHLLDAVGTWPGGVILRHRMAHQTERWHFAVFRAANARRVWTHDPLTSPDHDYERSTFLSLWDTPFGGPGPPWQLVAIAPRDAGPADCSACGSPIPVAVTCPTCYRPIGLRPASAIGCVRAECSARVWRAIFCPDCSCPIESIPAEEQIVPDEDPLIKLAAALENYQSVVAGLHKTMPPGETRDRIQTLFGQIKENFARLVPAVQEQREQVKAARAEAERKSAEAQTKLAAGKAKREELLARAAAPKEKPAKPLDPALGERLRELLLREASESA